MAQAFRTLWRARTVAWLLLPVSTWLVFEYRWVLDDAFVYFRYAENFAQTGELVFNLGEYVEGFTSPLWMVLLAITRAIGLRFWPVVVTVSIACSVLFCVHLGPPRGLEAASLVAHHVIPCRGWADRHDE